MGVEAKICGMRHAGDVRHAASVGARYVGCVLDDGPRQVPEDELGALVRAAGTVPVFLVVVRAGLDHLLRLRDATGIRGIQLHGSQDEVMAAALQRAGLSVWRAARVGSMAEVRGLQAWGASADAVLVEARVPGRNGGSGVPLALDLAVAAREQLGDVPMVLAGGLTPERVGDVVRLVRPDIVDVSSGVERAPGVKDPVRVARFVEALGVINARA